MARRLKSARYLRALRKKYGLGEFSAAARRNRATGRRRARSGGRSGKAGRVSTKTRRKAQTRASFLRSLPSFLR